MDVVPDAVEAIERRDWSRLRAILHPYLHWTAVDGRTIRGRTSVLAHLKHAAPSEPPAAYEVRDGQIYRWLERDRPQALPGSGLHGRRPPQPPSQPGPTELPSPRS